MQSLGGVMEEEQAEVSDLDALSLGQVDGLKRR